MQAKFLPRCSYIQLQGSEHTSPSYPPDEGATYMNAGLVKIVSPFNEMIFKTGRMKYVLNMSLVKTYLGAVYHPVHRRELPG